MNYYKFNIGDYAAATRHLTMLEHGAYRLLLDVYYTAEQPLPADVKATARKTGARSKEEIAAVETVLNDFFVLTEKGWIQSRCDAEIAFFQAKAETNRVVGKRGGRPKKETQTVFDGNPEITQTVSEINPQETLTTNHKPLTTNHKPLRQDTDSINLPSRAGAVCVVVKSAGIGNVNPSHPKLLELLADGAQVQEFEDAARKAADAGKGFAYALGIVKNAREDAKRAPKTQPQTESFKERDDRKARERWEQMTGEVHPDSVPRQPSNVIDITPQFLEIAK